MSSAATCEEEDGAFTLDFLVPRAVRLGLGNVDLERWYGGGSFETAQEFTLQPGDRLTGVDVVESGFTIWLEGPGHWTAHEAAVRIRDEAGHEIELSSTRSNPITVVNLAPGRHYVYLDSHCGDQPWQSQWYAGVADLADATPIDLAPGELQELTIDLLAGGRITGRIRNADGSSPAVAPCALYDLEGEPYCDDNQNVYDGIFDFRGLPDGDYYLGIRLSYNDYWWYPGTPNIAEGTVFHVEAHTQFTDLAWTLPPEEALTWR